MMDVKRGIYAVTLLRVALGLMFLAHSLILKIFIFGVPGTVQFFESQGLPEFMTYLVIGMEVVGGLMLILGIQARWVALALLPILLGAIWVHSGNGWVFSNDHGGWEYPVYLALLCICQFLMGDGRYALIRSTFISNNVQGEKA